jgi:hypothetical protein
VRQGFIEHFEPKLVKVEDHAHFEPEDLYHEKVRILDRFRK